MKELRYLVFFDKIGFYASKQSKNTEDWTFTRKIGESKRHKTITGAFIRLDYAKDLEEFKDVNRGILVEQVETKNNKEITKIIAKMDYKVMDKLVKEEVIEQPIDEVTTSKVIEPSIEPTEIEESVSKNTEEPIVLKKRRGRPPKTESTNNDDTDNKPKKRGRPPKTDGHIEGYQPSDDLDKTNPPKELTSTIKGESHVKVAKISAEDSFWD